MEKTDKRHNSKIQSNPKNTDQQRSNHSNDRENANSLNKKKDPKTNKKSDRRTSNTQTCKKTQIIRLLSKMTNKNSNQSPSILKNYSERNETGPKYFSIADDSFVFKLKKVTKKTETDDLRSKVIIKNHLKAQQRALQAKKKMTDRFRNNLKIHKKATKINKKTSRFYGTHSNLVTTLSFDKRLQQVLEKKRLRLKKRKIKMSYKNEQQMVKNVFKKVSLITLPSSKRPKNTKPFVLRSNDYLESSSPEKTSIIVSESTSPNQKKRDYLNLVPSNSLADIKTTDISNFREVRQWLKTRDRINETEAKKKRIKRYRGRLPHSLGTVELEGPYEFIDLSLKKISKISKRK